MTITRARYYPCHVRLPDEPRPRWKQFVILADGSDLSGLHVWNRPADTADLHLPVDWSRTTIPHTPRLARNGVDVHLADGRLVVLTPQPGCRCGSLGRWAGPSWANRVSV